MDLRSLISLSWVIRPNLASFFPSHRSGDGWAHLATGLGNDELIEYELRQLGGCINPHRGKVVVVEASHVTVGCLDLKALAAQGDVRFPPRGGQ